MKVSVAVAIYNVEKYLSKCLDSIINQSYENLEIICVDDGSTDSSVDIINNYILKDKRIKLVKQENKGLSCARNAGLDAATGDYIYFIDGDDIIVPDYIQSFVDLLKVKSYNVIHNPNIMLYYADNSNSNSMINIHQDNSFEENIITHSTWSKFYNLKFLRATDVRFYPGLRHQDYEHWNRLIGHIDDLGIVNKKDIYYIYRQRSGSITDISKKDDYNNHILIGLKSIYEYYLKNKNNSNLSFKPVNIAIVKNHLFDHKGKNRYKFLLEARSVLKEINDQDFLNKASKESLKVYKYFTTFKVIVLFYKSYVKK